MHIRADFLDLAARQGAAMAEAILARDELYLAPRTLSRAAAGRLRRGLKWLELYLRRLILLMALKIEPSLAGEQTERPVRQTKRWPLRSPITLRIFAGDGPEPDLMALADRVGSGRPRPAGPVRAAPLLQRLQDLKALAEAPEARARRLAWVIARRREPLIVPGFGRRMPPRMGTELSTLFMVLGASLPRAFAARPPPLGPPPRPPPRARWL